MHLLCLIFGHHRSRKGARRSGEGWKSVCKRCGRPMVRIRRNEWELAEPGQEAPASDRESEAADAS